MEIKNKRQILSVFLSVLVSVFVVSLAVYAATTIGTNIVTTGETSMTTASTTGNFWLGNQTADNDDYLYMDASSSEYLMWDDEPGSFVFSGGITVEDATNTGELILGASTWDAPTSTLTVVGTAYINRIATTSEALWIGTGGAATNIDVDGGDLYVQDDAEIDDDLFVTDAATIGGNTVITGTASTSAAIFSGNATTTGNMVIGYNNQLVTTTLTLGSYDNSSASEYGVCFRIRKENGWKYCYVVDTGFVCGDTSCE